MSGASASAAEGGFKPTAEQEAIIEAVARGRGSVMVSADAGAAKTSTMVLAARAMPAQPALAIAFNKRTAQELAERFPSYWTVKTMNGLGYGAWAKKLGGKLTLNDNKGWDIIRGLERAAGMKLLDEERNAAKGLLDAARSAGLVHKVFAEGAAAHTLEDSFENWQDLYIESAELPHELYALAREALKESTRRAFDREVDFDDMIYCSVMLGGIYATYPFVAVDESQDLNTMNHEQVRRSLKPQGRMLVVGDKKQSIYGFRGTHRESMEEMRKLRPRESWVDLPLHVTFRCPAKVVARQQAHAPGYAAAPGAKDGEVYDWRSRDDDGMIAFQGVRKAGWEYDWLKALRRPGDKVYVLCRNNAPIMRLAFQLIRQGVIPEVLGKEIGKGLIALTKKLAPKKDASIAALLEKLEDWVRDERAKAEMMNRSGMLGIIEDKAESLKAICEASRSRDAGSLRRDIERLFAQSRGEVTLASIHKAKGLEGDVVLHLDPWRIPSKRALERAAATGDQAELEQERNLRYVAETRTKRVLIEADADGFMGEG